MASDVFIDTSGFYALLVGGDDRHGEAAEFLRLSAAKKRRFVTTDYVVDETATLLQARGLQWLVARFFDSVFSSTACRVAWMDAERFNRTRVLFLRSLERRWSFTDCMSFVVMKELRLRDALTKDEHFKDAGFVALLA
jgi:predicted nucleic acid-binding protein